VQKGQIPAAPYPAGDTEDAVWVAIDVGGSGPYVNRESWGIPDRPWKWGFWGSTRARRSPDRSLPKVEVLTFVGLTLINQSAFHGAAHEVDFPLENEVPLFVHTDLVLDPATHLHFPVISMPLFAHLAVAPNITPP